MAKQRSTPNVLEHVVAAIGMLLTLAVVGVLIWDAVNDDGEGPRLRIELGRPVAAEGAVHVPVRVHNDGGETAADVTVEVCRGEGAAAECAETTFPFVPRGSERDGVVGFTAATGPLTARVASYQRP